VQKLDNRSGTKSESDYAIEVKNVSKRFKIPHEKRTTIYDNIMGMVRGRSYSYEVFEALQDMSFKIKKGESFGIIGENGSGKSTLLKILAGVLVPDSGHVKVNGKVAPFLELGVGFQPELTAVENVYLYGAIMGMDRKQMDVRLDPIFDFAELDRFRDAKLKNFSSGMYARLAFATAISTDPDVLLIDEVLAVGDEAFQVKCYDKIDEYKRQGKTIVLVSHALNMIQEVCTNCLMLQKGNVKSIGSTGSVISAYIGALHKKEEHAVIEKEHTVIDKKEETPLIENEEEYITAGQNEGDGLLNMPEKTDDTIKDDTAPVAITPAPAIVPASSWGSKEAAIVDVKFFNDQNESGVFQTGDRFIAKIKYRTSKRIEKPVFGVAIYKDHMHLTGPNTKFSKIDIDIIDGDGEIDFVIDELPLLDGDYRFSAAIYDHSCKYPHDHQHCAFEFKVENAAIRNYGIFHIPGKWILR
jgi:ABC-type polysaccharide/polyol phosphate transport system ATPase subunit